MIRRIQWIVFIIALVGILVYLQSLVEPVTMYLINIVFIILGAIVIGVIHLREGYKTFNRRTMIRGVWLLVLTLTLGLGVTIYCLAG